MKNGTRCEGAVFSFSKMYKTPDRVLDQVPDRTQDLTLDQVLDRS